MSNTPRVLATALALSITLPTQAALAAPSKEFHSLSKRAKAADSASDYARAAQLYEQAYGTLSDADRVGQPGRTAVLESVAAREQAFHLDTAQREMLVAAEKFLERHIADIQRTSPDQPTADIGRRLDAVRMLKKMSPEPAATTYASTATAEPVGPWVAVINGQRVGPLDRVSLAEAYLAGVIDDDTLLSGPGDTESVPLATSTVFASLNQWHYGHGERWHGPVSRDQLLATIDKGRREGYDVDSLSVRLAWSKKTFPLPQAAPLRAKSVAAYAPVVPADQRRTDGVDDYSRDDDETPPTGTGLLVSGTAIMGLGTITFLAGVGLALAKPFPSGDGSKVGYAPKVWGPPLGVGLVALAVAAPLVIVGAARHRQYRLHQQRVQVGMAPMRGRGLQAGISLRF